jgi:hypothetical protein
MTNDKDGGSNSGSGAGDSAGQNKGAGDGKNKTAKMSMDQALAEVERLTKEGERKDSVISDLTTQLDEANKVLEGQQKAKLIGEILPRSNFKLDELTGKSPEDLQNIRATLDMAMPPKVNSVRFGVSAADLSDREKGLTVGDLSKVTAAKRKALRGA